MSQNDHQQHGDCGRRAGRPAFREWIDAMRDPKWPLMPLTHTTKGVHAEDICRSGFVSGDKETVAYFFYGRPAYRVHGDGALKLEAACPFCFVFEANLVEKANAIFAFDTGAFEKRMYKHILLDEMDVEDFSLEKDLLRPNRLISTVFGDREAYFFGDRTRIGEPEALAAPFEMHARSYLHLIKSPGRNEPDDRICSIEVQMPVNVPLEGALLAAVVPHTMWEDQNHAPWLQKVVTGNVIVAPYMFVPGRHPDYYYALMEIELRNIYRKWGVL